MFPCAVRSWRWGTENTWSVSLCVKTTVCPQARVFSTVFLTTELLLWLMTCGEITIHKRYPYAFPIIHVCDSSPQIAALRPESAIPERGYLAFLELLIVSFTFLSTVTLFCFPPFPSKLKIKTLLSDHWTVYAMEINRKFTWNC